MGWAFLGILILFLSGCGQGDLVTSTKVQSTVTPIPIRVSNTPTRDLSTISGTVLGEHGLIADAVLRIQTTEVHTISDEDGKFSLTLDEVMESPIKLTGWAKGYFCSGPFEVNPSDQNVVVELIAHADDDNPDYDWLPSLYHPGEGEDQGCAECHSREGTDLAFSLPVDEWLLDAHSGSATNPRFLTMYNGTDLNGNQSPLTRMGYSRDYGSFPLPPDTSQPYYGPGYKLDFPDSDGNCSACHTPAAAINAPYSTDPNTLTGIESEGVPCDFCHKVWDVELNPASNLPYQNMPGVLSFNFRRPHEGHQFFAGPLDDVAPGEDTYSHLQTQSAYCAPCHFGIFWDTVIYNSYGEWLASPYSDPETGKTCQDCHMPPLGVSQFATKEAGGLIRDPNTIFSHRMPGASDLPLLQDALDMRVDVERDDEMLQVTIHLVNDNTGHKIPTDSPLRHVLLIVQAQDADGNSLLLLEGPTLPAWAGVGDPEQGYYAGLPGMDFALILEELWTEISPSGAYWNPTRVVEDTRLEPFVEVESTYRFNALKKDELNIVVRVLLRRAFIDLMDQKGWSDPDVLMAEQVLLVGPED